MKAFLILEDGTVFEGTSIGSKRDMISEIVFNTSMTGYLEVLPDHPTPLSTKTHASDPVPYLIYDSAREQCSGVSCFCEETAKQTGNYVEAGPMLIEKLFSAIQA